MFWIVLYRDSIPIDHLDGMIPLLATLNVCSPRTMLKTITVYTPKFVTLSHEKSAIEEVSEMYVLISNCSKGELMYIYLCRCVNGGAIGLIAARP
jgi:hypothetical protein